jgi:leucyl-tRNA synthetase
MRETNTMPGYAGSSWYFLRYMDPHNEHAFADRAATDYWQQVDLYVGGTEHAVGHLLYARMWTKALHDLGYIGFDEPFKRLLNQGMIQGSSRFVYRVAGTNHFVSHGLKSKYETSALHVDVSLVDDVHLNIEAFKSWRTEYQDATFELENGSYICGAEVEKMSKSKYNVVNPDDIILQYGADTFRMYEMFLGPIDMSKPWDTKGIEGVYRFVKKLWRLYADETKGWIVTTEAPTDAENKVLHKTIKKITEHLERFSFNTCISQFMITVNELTTLQCHKAAILEPLAVVLSPFAPHVAEELWHQLGHTTTIVDAPYPTYEERFVVDNTKVYPVAINGKPRAEMEFALDMDEAALKAAVLTNDAILKYTEGKEPKKFIYVKGKMINIVI